MGIINQHWYSANQAVAYPVDDAATAIDDAGRPLPGNVVVDLSLRWPSLLGRYAFLAAVSVTPNVVTIAVQAADAVDEAGGFVPLAVLSVPAPVLVGKPYALLPQAAGVGGWVVFGNGVSDRPYGGRFSSPAQSLLTARAARAYAMPPVGGIRLAGADTALTGLVILRGQKPVQVVAEEREVGGVLRDCVVVRLVDDSGDSGFPVPADLAAIAGGEPGVLRKFAGPCAGRPESGSCGDPQPIEFINTVGPDCRGVVTLALAGCAAPIPVAGESAAAIACAFGLAAACPPPQAFDSILPRPVFTPAATPASPVSATGTTAGASCTECFAGGSTGSLVFQVGLWRAVRDSTDHHRDCPGDSSSLSDGEPAGLYVLGANSAAGRNVATLDCAGTGALNRTVAANVKFAGGPFGARHNAAVVACYQALIGSVDQFVYYVAEADYDTQQLRIAFYNGATFMPLGHVAVPGLQLGPWYRLTLTSADGSFGPTTLRATLASLADGAVSAALEASPISIYPTYYGLFGVATDRAVSRFSIVSAG